MERYEVLYGDQVTRKHFTSVVELDGRNFVGFQTPVDFLWKLYKNYPESFIVLWDNQADKAVGYMSVFPVNNNFLFRHTKAGERFSHNAFEDPVYWTNNSIVHMNVYTFCIDKNLRGNTPIRDGKPAFKLLNEGLLRLLVSFAKRGIFVIHLFMKCNSDKAIDYAKSLGLKEVDKCVVQNRYVYMGQLTETSYKKCFNNPEFVDAYRGFWAGMSIKR